MRVTRAGSCDTILWRTEALLRGSSTVLMILAVTSGNVAMGVTLRTGSETRFWGSASVAVGMDVLFLPRDLPRVCLPLRSFTLIETTMTQLKRGRIFGNI